MPTIPINDIDLFYTFRGQATDPTIVFVNGLLTDTSSWEPILPFFTDRYRCLVYDCRGQKQSSKPDHLYETHLHTLDLIALLDALQLERIALVGLSNGGAAGLEFASMHPERVTALAVCGTYAHVDTGLRVKLTSWVKSMEVGGSALRFDVATPWVWGDTFLAQHYERLLPFRERGANLPISPAMNLIRGAMIHDIRAQLPRITAPTLMVVGEDDLLTPPKLSRQIAASITGAQLHVMRDAGHAAALEQPETFAQLVRGFFDGVL